MEIPPGFQNDLQRGRQPEVNAFIDAAVPFRAETSRGYLEGAQNPMRMILREQKGIPQVSNPITFQVRALFNQDFKSIYAMVPGDIMLLLILIPSMLTALSVVREKELGSIANFYAAPATRLEFLLGKQLPYLACRAHSVCHPRGARDPAVSGTAERQLGNARGRRHHLFHGEHRVRSADLGVREHANGGDLCRGHHHHSPRDAILRNVRAGVFALRRSVGSARRYFQAPTFRPSAWVRSRKRLGFASLWPNFVALGVIALIYFSVSVLLLKKQEN